MYCVKNTVGKSFYDDISVEHETCVNYLMFIADFCAKKIEFVTFLFFSYKYTSRSTIEILR